MRLNRLSFFLLPILALATLSCIDPEETDTAILEADKRAIAEYLDENPIVSVKEVSDDITGIRIFWQEVSGSGVPAEVGDTVSVNYTGRLLTNRVFDSSIESIARDNNVFNPNRNYTPITFVLGQLSLIEGFEIAVNEMELGDKATVLMPSGFAYGKNPVAGVPIDAPLIFELDVVEISKRPQP